jgi:hypothetical protein
MNRTAFSLLTLALPHTVEQTMGGFWGFSSIRGLFFCCGRNSQIFSKTLGKMK